MRLYKAILIFLNAIIGTGIFFTPILITLTTNSVYSQFIIWVVLGFIFLMYALIFSEMIKINPRRGGIYDYIKPLNNHLAFLSGWIEAFSILILIAFLLNLSFNNISSILDISFFGYNILENKWVLYGAILLLYSFIISRGVKISNETMFLFGIFSLLAFLGFLVFVIYLYKIHNIDVHPLDFDENPDYFKYLPLLVAAIFETYAGVEILGYFANKKNKETLSLATKIGSLIVIALYITLTIFLLPLVKIVGDPYSIHESGRYLYLLASVQVLGTVFVWMNSLPNLLYRMAKDNNLPRIFEKLNKKKVPIYNLILTAAVSFLFASFTPINSLIKVYFVGILFVYSIVSLSMLRILNRLPIKKYNPLALISLILTIFPLFIGYLYKKELLLFVPITVVGTTLYLSREIQRNKTLVKIFHDIFFWIADFVWKLELKVDYPKIRKILGNLDNKIVLDYGSSTGELSIRIAKDHKHSIVYASDISKRSLKRLEKKIRRMKLSNIVPILEEPDTIYHKFSNFFDVIIVYHTITLIKDRKKFFRSLKRSLKNDGKVLIVFYRRLLIFDSPKWVDNLWKTLMKLGFDVFVDEEKGLLYEKWYILAKK